ncbi:family 20 glycosylhydrolase, partial [Acinetobacter baumannii]|uniref:family 20 glycosylhydrolase n=1 Tax=Acinetobacter baumannii TaxID=470 RepID=UPI0031F3D446
FLDDMALQKLNWFHFHLTEDQGWRVEIKKYPLLTEIGSRRSHTNFNNKAHGGYYTQEDIKEIVEYAHSKYIKIMPEIDIPGHSRA